MKIKTSGGGAGASSRDNSEDARRTNRVSEPAPRQNTEDNRRQNLPVSDTGDYQVPADQSASVSRAVKNINWDIQQTFKDQKRSVDLRRITNPYFRGFVDPATGDPILNGDAAASSLVHAATSTTQNPPEGFTYKPWMKQYPAVAQAALNAGLTKDEWGTLNGYFELQMAKNQLMTAAQVGTQAISYAYAGINPQIRDIAMQQLSQAYQASLNAPADPNVDPEANQSWLSTAWNFSYDHSVGAALDSWAKATEFTQHIARAAQYGTINNVPNQVAAINAVMSVTPLGQVGELQNVWNNWAATETGTFDPKIIEQAKQQYGARDVQMLQDLILSDQDPKNSYGAYISKYANTADSARAWQIMNMYMFDDQRTQDFTNMLALITGSDTGDLGVMTMSRLAGAENSLNNVSKLSAQAINAGAVLATDPTFVATKTMMALKVAKYGMAMTAVKAGDYAAYTAAAGRVHKIMQIPSVRRFWDTMGGLAEQYNRAVATKNDMLAARTRAEMRGLVQQHMGFRNEELTATYVKTHPYFQNYRMPGSKGVPLGPVHPEPSTAHYTNLVDEIIKNKLYTADDAQSWIESGVGLELILQGAPGAGVPMMPRLSKVSRYKLTKMLQSKTFDWQKNLWDFVHTYYGQGIESQALGRALEDKDTLAARGRELGVDPDSVKRRVPLPTGGKYRKRGVVSYVAYGDTSGARRMDRFLKNFTRSPYKRSINISDARDAEAVRAWARVTLDKAHADLLYDHWFRATPAERRTILQGMSLTAAEAMGIRANAAEDAERLLSTIVDGQSVGTSYGTTIARPKTNDEIMAWIRGLEWRDDPVTGKQIPYYPGTNVQFDYQDLYPQIRQAVARKGNVLEGARLELAGGAKDAEESDKLLRHELYGLISKRKDLVQRRADLQEKIRGFKGSVRGQAAIDNLKSELRDVENELSNLDSSIGRRVRDNDESGRRIARDMGLESISDLRDISLSSIDDVTGDLRDAGLSAVRDVRDAAKVPGVAENPDVAFAAQYGRADINQTATAGKAEAKKDVRDQAALGRDAVRHAARVQEALGKENYREIVDLFRQIRKIRKQAKKAGKSGSPQQQAALQAKLQKMQDRIDELLNGAGLATYKINQAQMQIAYIQALREGAPLLDTINPSTVFGKSYALHSRQTADHVTLPDFQRMQQFSLRTGALNALMGMSYSDWATNLTDMWSLATLAGPRYALRNAFEDAIFYNLSKGRYRNYFRARSATKAMRIAHGDKLGGSLHSVTMAKWFPHVTDAEIKAALEARASGDFDPLRQLVAKGMARGSIAKYGVRFQTPEMMKYIDDLVGSGMADQYMASLARTADMTVRQSNGMTTNPVEILNEKRKTIGYKSKDTAPALGSLDTRWVNLHVQNDEGIDAWWTAIHDFAEGDGAIGKKVIAGIGKLSRAKFQDRDKIREEIINDLVNTIEKSKSNPRGYYNRFGMISDHGPRVFANSYLMEAETVFSGSTRGSYNEKLLNMLRDDQGNIRMIDRTGGKNRPAITPSDLQKFEDWERPREILGPDTKIVPMANRVQNGMDSLWSIMGQQYAHIATEPMFVARYLQQRQKMAGYEQALSAQMGPEVAAKTANRLAADRAYEELFAYADNPSNRSLIAFNARNIARYYRATEDFYRRALRLVKYHPDQVAKAALVAHLMDESGFIHQDDQGNKYFMYPNGIPAINWVMAKLNIPLQIPSVYGQFSGRFDMLTPSADPTAWLPTFSGPFIAAPIAAIANMWEPFGTVQGVASGAKSVGRPVWDSILPPIVSQSIGILQSNDEALGKFAANLRTVMFSRAANGDIPGPDASAQERDNWLQDSKMQAEGVTILQAVLRLALPASPQFNTSNLGHISDEAAAAGLGNLRTDFIKMVNANQAEKDPWKTAYQQWLKVNPRLSIWTVSKMTDVSTANISRTTAAADWVQANMDLFKVSSEGASYLIPSGGVGSLEGHRRLVAYGVLMPKPVEQLATELITSERLNHYFDVNDEVNAKIAALPADDPNRRIWKQNLTQFHKDYLAKYPLVDERVKNSKSRTTKESTPQEILKVLDTMKERRPDQYAADPSLALIRKMVVNFIQAKVEIGQVVGNTKQADDTRAMMKANASAWLREWSGIDKPDGDPRAIQVYQNLMASFLGDKNAD